jgi:hypothetical protein
MRPSEPEVRRRVWLELSGRSRKAVMECALWSLIDESHLCEQPHQPPILKLTHQLCLQTVDRTMGRVRQHMSKVQASRTHFCVSLISNSTLLPYRIQQLPDRLMRRRLNEVHRYTLHVRRIIIVDRLQSFRQIRHGVYLPATEFKYKFPKVSEVVLLHAVDILCLACLIGQDVD